MTLNGVMAVTLRYFNEFGKPALQKTICGGIDARVYCILVRVQCRRKESSRSLSHLLMSLLYIIQIVVVTAKSAVEPAAEQIFFRPAANSAYRSTQKLSHVMALVRHTYRHEYKHARHARSTSAVTPSEKKVQLTLIGSPQRAFQLLLLLLYLLRNECSHIQHIQCTNTLTSYLLKTHIYDKINL